ncbi:hypothetical protein ACI77N_13120 [Pseudomonas sp. S191]|uniref:hypothetical protein n=1 Tax=Pseudomonas sp. S191 TaxID=579575 RepID=UPI00387AFD42
MAGKADVKAQETEGNQPEAIQVTTLGEAIFTPSLAGRALADLLIARLTNLHTTQLQHDALTCGLAVRAAFEALEKAEGPQ